MKKYQSIYEDYDLQMAKFHEEGIGICGENMFEAVIKPELYIENLLELIDDNKSILKKFTHPEDICTALSALYKSHKIFFKVSENKLSDSIVHDAGHTKENIFIFCNPNIVDAYENYKEFKIQFERLLKHEIIHRQQFLRVNNEEVIQKIIKKSRQDQINYFKSKQEIMAYAWQIVYDFRITGKPDEVIKELINKESFFATKNSKILEIYKNLFKEGSEEIKLLYKYIYMYLDNK